MCPDLRKLRTIFHSTNHVPLFSGRCSTTKDMATAQPEYHHKKDAGLFHRPDIARGLPKVSVCMPIYNASLYLKECIDSILCQTFEDFELIIVDDGSTDNSLEIVRSYTDPRIRLIENHHDYIDSLNLLLQKARGKYVARMDADDKMRPNRLAIQFAYMEEHTSVDILGGGMMCFGDGQSTYSLACVGEFGCMELMESCCFAHPTVFMRKSSIEKANIKYRKEYIYAEDYAFWVEAACKGLALYNIEDTLIDYRLSPTQITRTKGTQQRNNSASIKRNLVNTWFNLVEKYLDETTPLSASGNALTVVIPFYNEGIELIRTVSSIRKTVGNAVDIIVVNDKSDDDFNYEQELAPMNVTFITNPHRMGPAVSKEKGVQCCGTQYFIILDAHMRFYQSDWASILVKELSNNSRQILCCQTKPLRKIDGVVSEEKTDPTFGAYIYWGMKEYTPMSVWNPNPKARTLQTGNIPCVLGASYASSKEYWNYLRGFHGLLCYGCEEPFISLKAWLEGGKCKFVSNVTIGHIYKDYSTVSLMNAKYVYNFLFIAYTLLPTSLRCKVEAVVRSKNPFYYESAKSILNASEKYWNTLKNELNAILKNRDFDYIKSISYILHPNAEYNLEQMLSDTSGLITFCEDKRQSVTDIGLYQGLMGYAILFSLYFRYTSEAKWKHKALYLIHEVNKHLIDMKDALLSFSSGVAGVGWGLLYLVDNNLLSYEEVAGALTRIDSKIVALSPRRMTDLSLETGYTGIVAYCTARIGFCKRHNTICKYPEDFVQEMITACKQYCQNNNCPPDAYSYSLHLLGSQLESEDWETTKIDFTDVMELPTYLTKDQVHWEANLRPGCIGYAINLLITKYKLDENK